MARDPKEMNNYCIVEGVLSEINLELATFNGDDVIRGDILVKVVAPIVKDGPEVECEIPVRFFSKKLTKAGNENPAYASAKNILDTGKSIAAVGIEEADRVSIRGARLAMNEYFTPDGRLIAFPTINGSFVNVIRKSECNPQAKADFTVSIERMYHETDDDGIETGKFIILGANVGYGGYTNVLPIVTDNPSYIAAIEATYKEGDFIDVSARLNFTSITETTYEEVEIGDPIERKRTKRLSDVVISAVRSNTMLPEIYTRQEILGYVQERNNRLEAKRTDVIAKGNAQRSHSADKAKANLGF